MKLTEALKLAQAPPPSGGRPLRVGLACGFTAHHLQVFLTAQLRARGPDRVVAVATGVYGDGLGNLDRLAPDADATALVVEWPDLDPRLGLRLTGGWSPDALPDVLLTVDAQADRYAHAVARAAGHGPVAVCLPTLPLPPIAFTPGWLDSEFEALLTARVATLAAELARLPNVRLVNARRLDHESPPTNRLDVRGEFGAGFPYQTPHASAVAELLACLLLPPAPKKGLITDLDDTLWAGLLGEVGPAGVSWDLDRRSQAHALYQQLLQSLADSGTLLAVATKNDPARVAEAFRRGDLLLRPESVFPVEAHWEPKSGSVDRILRAWNVAADSVVFVDDSPLELAEVQAAHPAIEAIRFPRGSDAEVYALLGRLRDLFGKSAVRDEDRLRLDSLRQAAAFDDAVDASRDRDAFLRGVEAELTFDLDEEPPAERALELVNKTNQFNLNGRRFDAGEWQAYRDRTCGILLVVSYKDKFGPLGKIAVLGGRRDGDRLVVDTWVLSCRAFSRRIEHGCLAYLFERFGVESIAFDFVATPRNGPVREFLAGLVGQPPQPGLTLGRDRFAAVCPPLFHQIKEPVHG